MSKRLDKGSEFLSNLVYYRTYGKTLENGYKESREEMFRRVASMHIKKFPFLQKEIEEAFYLAQIGWVLPSMRTCQFAPYGIERENTRVFNCSYLPIADFKAFGEIMFLLCCGTGVGYSVRRSHISKLPNINKGYSAYHKIADSKEGWAIAIEKLLANPSIEFGYENIRAEGAPLSTGGTASGPMPLIAAIEQIRNILRGAIGRQLNSVECSDIVCLIADCVVVGAVRRSATICLFDWTDERMLNYKSGNWWKFYPYRARANISAVLYRKAHDAKKAFRTVIEACFRNKSGEPGIFWTNDSNDLYGVNPCVEASLRSYEFCNLTSNNASAFSDEKEFYKAVEASTLIGTLQSTYETFSYLRPEWQRNLQESRLLGVSITGIAEATDLLTANVLKRGAEHVVNKNKEIAARLGIEPAARSTCIKPEGTSSAALGTSSGVHSHKSKYHIRRVRMDISHELSKYLWETMPPEFVEVDQMNPKNIVVSTPIAKPHALTQDDESPIQLMDRAKMLYKNWILPGHDWGDNPHNVSITVNYKENEQEDIAEWMWKNRDYYCGIALFPKDDTVYPQLPFETITEDKYNELIKKFPDIDLSKVNYLGITEETTKEIACGGGACEWGIK